MRRFFGSNGPADQPLEAQDEGAGQEDFAGSFHGSQHSGARGSSRVSGRRSQDRRSVTRRSNFGIGTLRSWDWETCQRIVYPQEGLRCPGCEKWTHEHCQVKLDIGHRFHAWLCLTCNQEMSRNLRIIGGFDLPSVRLNNEDAWFRRVLEAQALGIRIDTGSPKER